MQFLMLINLTKKASQSHLTLASQTRKLELAPPSKPQKPLPQPQPEAAIQKNDEDKAFQAAVYESLKAPSSPRPESGAQSSTPQPAVDLEQQEVELIARMDRLMEESVRLEALPNPTLRDRSRIRSVATVMDDIEQQLKEIGEQKRAQSSLKKPKIQDTRAPKLTTGVQVQESKGSVAVEKVRSVAPPSTQPLTLDNLMASVTQPEPSPPTAEISPEAQLLEIVGHDQPKAHSQAMPIEDRPQPQQQLIVIQAQPPVGRQEVSKPPSPASEERPTKERRESAVEPSRERERTPASEHSRSRRRHSPPPPSCEREVTTDSPKVRSKESKKAEKKKKKESRHRRRSESDEPRRSRPSKEERSRSTRRPESPVE